MALTTHNGNGAHRLSPTSSNGRITPRSGGVRPTLPHRGVTDATIEDAYVTFILYCNPAVPLDIDTTALREAFRTPPKSEGKNFSTFTLFELITKLHHKELKTWAELALKLGVQPPDQDKGQSSQKIQQYAVRLKRWMHSMHVNAFFDYLLDNPHPYWTHVPTDPNPVNEEGRDGVAAEDDMALRALLPHIRPKRGRKRPDDDNLSKSPSQRPRFDSPSFNDDSRNARPDLDAWTAHPDGRAPFAYPTSDPRSNGPSGPDSAFPWQNDAPREPMSAYPQSAMTPSTRGAYWPELTEPRSAITPLKNRSLGRRHGAKAVSSAWRSSGAPIGGKARGRPPLGRPNESPVSAYPDDRRGFHDVALDQPPPVLPVSPHQESMMRPYETTSTDCRPPRPNRLSLQVPERAGAPVRLATPPPPTVMVNGKSTPTEDMNDNPPPERKVMPDTEDTFTIFDRSSEMFRNPRMKNSRTPMKNFELEAEDTTNYTEIEALFLAEMYGTPWYDDKGQVGPIASIDEVTALVRVIIDSISNQALTKEAFLINLAALAGGTHLLQGIVNVSRLEVTHESTKYLCAWTLRYGTASGKFTLTEVVPHSMWKREFSHLTTPGYIPPEPAAAAEFWRKKYGDMVLDVRKKEDNIVKLKESTIQVMKNLRDGEWRPQEYQE